jgi:hypothetical protein
LGQRQSASILRELRAQHPALISALVGYGRALEGSAADGVEAGADIPFLTVQVRSALSRQEHERLVRWFRARIDHPEASVLVSVAPRRR